MSGMTTGDGFPLTTDENDEWGGKMDPRLRLSGMTGGEVREVRWISD